MRITHIVLGCLAGVAAGTALPAAMSEPAPSPDASVVAAPKIVVRVVADYPERDLADFCALASSVVTARVMNKAVALEATGRVTTTLELQTIERIEGETPDRFLLSYPAGEDGGVLTTHSHDPRLEPGEEALLFLVEGHPGHFGLLGLVQGVVRRHGTIAQGHLAQSAESWTQFRTRLDHELAQRTQETR